MNTDRLVLSHPLNCIEHHSTYEAARDGEGWERQYSNTSGQLITGMIIHTVSIPVVATVLMRSENPIDPFMLVALLIVYGAMLVTIVDLWKRRRLLKQLPRKRLPTEQA